MSLTQRDVLTPDAVIAPGGSFEEEAQQRALDEQERVMKALTPCPVCGANPHESPEGMDPISGAAQWVNPHCWRCGFRPAADPTAEVEKQKMFATFQQWYQMQTAQDMAHPTLNAPTPDDAAAMKARIAELEQQLSGRAPNIDPTSSQPMTQPEPGVATPGPAVPGTAAAPAPAPAPAEPGGVPVEPIPPSQPPADQGGNV